jgi:hypothetical protein
MNAEGYWSLYHISLSHSRLLNSIWAFCQTNLQLQTVAGL